MNLNKIGYAYTPLKISASSLTGNIIAVTRKHINKGDRGECTSCPVALALLDAFPEAKRVSVDQDDLVVTYPNGSAKSYCVPRSVSRFINKFDNQGRVAQPFRFKLVAA